MEENKPKIIYKSNIMIIGSLQEMQKLAKSQYEFVNNIQTNNIRRKKSSLAVIKIDTLPNKVEEGKKLNLVKDHQNEDRMVHLAGQCNYLLNDPEWKQKIYLFSNVLDIYSLGIFYKEQEFDDGIPFIGGNITQQETIRSGAIRQLQEKTGLTIKDKFIEQLIETRTFTQKKTQYVINIFLAKACNVQPL